jgi:hypothetical protein
MAAADEAFLAALLSSDVEEVRRACTVDGLLANRPLIDLYNTPPVVLAAMMPESPALLRALIAFGANVDAQNVYGRTALMLSVSTGPGSRARSNRSLCPP